MLNYKVSPARVNQSSHPSQVECWLIKQEENSDHLAAIINNSGRAIIYEALTGEWLAKLDGAENGLL